MIKPRTELPRRYEEASFASSARATLTRRLLVCGILSSVLYAAMLVFVPLQWATYSSSSQTVSELSAIGAPSRTLWMSLGLLWTALYVAFGWGVWRAAAGRRALRLTGGAIVAAGVLGLFWPPMHQRDVLAAGGATLTDTLHLAWTMVNGLLTLAAMAVAAAALGNRFRRYTLATMVTLVVAGALTSVDAPGVDANLPTPWIGVWERINIGAWLLWVLVLAATLLGRPSLEALSGRFASTRRGSELLKRVKQGS
jgi:hypothetical protein